MIRTLLAVLALLPRPVMTQSLREEARIARKVDYFTTDRLGNAYLVCPDGLYKYSPAGELQASFADKSFGNISSIDATDPLKIVLFNRVFRNVYILDDKLSVQTSFNLVELGLDQPQLICTSRHDGYWVYDAQFRKLVKLNSSLVRTFEGEILSGKLEHLDPDYLVESANWILLNDPRNGVILTDPYGTYFKVLRDVDAPGFQCKGDWLVFLDGDRLVKLETGTLAREAQELPPLSGIRQVRIENNRMYLITPEAFYIYAF